MGDCRSSLALALALLLVRPAWPQMPPPQTGPLSPAAARVKETVEQLPIGGKLTVNMLDGHEYYGRLSSIDAESFRIREVDLKQILTLRYDDVEKVRKDYGRRGFGGKRVHPKTNRTTALIFVGALLGLTVAVVAASK